MEKIGILFDLDGTLWDTANSTWKSVNKITKKYGRKKIDKETIKQVFHLNKIEIAQLYFPDLPLKESLLLVDEIAQENIKRLKKYGGNLYPNLEKVLVELKKNYPLFIVSGTSESKYIESFLISSRLEKYFHDYIASSEIHLTKAQAIKKVMKDYQLEKVIYIGDTEKDLEASKKAKAFFIQAKYGFGNDLKTTYFIDHMKELPKVIETLHKSR